MKINCISCGHNLSLDEAYDDFSGLVRCYVCGSLLEIKTTDGKLLGVNLAQISPPQQHPVKSGSIQPPVVDR
jgi:hypothetical protein